MIRPPANDRRPSSSLGTERGQALTEFVLALPILAVLLVAVVQFGSVLNEWVEVSQAARVGARTASVSRKSDDGSANAVDAARGSVSKVEQEQLQVAVTPDGPWTKGSPVTVRVSSPFEVNVLGLVVRSGTMTSEATARVQ
jgi:Flp pilus assembly protein TadG